MSEGDWPPNGRCPIAQWPHVRCDPCGSSANIPHFCAIVLAVNRSGTSQERVLLLKFLDFCEHFKFSARIFPPQIRFYSRYQNPEVTDSAKSDFSASFFKIQNFPAHFFYHKNLNLLLPLP
jgi:hypothetical protein